MAKVLAAMSGGVDSSVAAAFLQQQGHEVVGVYMKNWINEDQVAGHCPWQEDIEDARRAAQHLGIEFRVINFMNAYRERVVNYLIEGYKQGVTPNPDVLCNREMKFGILLDYALNEGFAYVATGHYARKQENAEGSCDLLRGVDTNKDQTYFLALLKQHQLKRALFPIGHLQKPEVRIAARQINLPNAEKKDSQGICFLGEVKMQDFLKHYVEDQPGNIVTLEGKKLGEHRGLHYYTLGQRKGIQVPSNTANKAYVVVEKRYQTKELVIAFDEVETPKLYAKKCLVTEMSFPNREIAPECDVHVQPRYRSQASRAHCVYHPEERRVNVSFEEPQRALTPGQICAFYEGDTLIAGGVFAEIYPPRNRI